MGTWRRNDVDATSLRRIDIITTSCACWEFGPPLAPQYSKPWPPNILNFPMQQPTLTANQLSISFIFNANLVEYFNKLQAEINKIRPIDAHGKLGETFVNMCVRGAGEGERGVAAVGASLLSLANRRNMR